MWGLPIEVTGTAVINHFGHLLVKEDKGFPVEKQEAQT
jgi:hypothetical protein